MQRIHLAADSLFEQNERASFPTVDAVRKAARVNMSDANSGMREWRRNQLARAAPARVQLPAAIAQAQAALAAELWQTAQTAAGESLAVAQAAWGAERQQLETLNKEMAEAFEAQAAELEIVRGELESRSTQAESAASACARLQLQLEALQTRLASAEHDAKRDAMRLEEAIRRADELRRDLDHAHQELAAAHIGGHEARRAHADELSAVRADARQAEAVLREELEALRRQQRALMQIVSGASSGALPKGPAYNEKSKP
jgi:chromosome segregation ATPase